MAATARSETPTPSHRGTTRSLPATRAEPEASGLREEVKGMKKVMLLVSLLLAVDHLLLDGELIVKQLRRLTTN
jgi:hypothetical protein